MPEAFDQRTLAFYALHAETYVDRPTDLHPALAKFLQLLPPKAQILELGCGGGRDAKHMIDLGFDVDPTDGVPEMAAQAETWLGRPVRVMRFDALEAEDRYDAVIANASLLHVPLTGLGGILQRVWKSLKSNGYHFASYKTGAPEERDEHDRYYNRLTRLDAETFYQSAGQWSRFDLAESFEPGCFGEPSHWLMVTAQKAQGATR